MPTYTYRGTTPIAGFDYNPWFAEIVNADTANVVSLTPTAILFSLDNGLKLRLSGSGFALDADGNAKAGTVTTISVLAANGTTVIADWIGLSISLPNFEAAADVFDPWRFAEWLASGNDIFNGGAGDDEFEGGRGNDTFNGGAGYDFFAGGEGRDTYNGGADDDGINFSDAYNNAAAFRGVVIDSIAGTVSDPYGNAETFTSIEKFVGTQFVDTMRGSNVAFEEFRGLGGADIIDGRGGFDMVRYDRDINRGGDQAVNVNLATGKARDSFGYTDTLISIEGVRTGELNDVVIGNAANNTIRTNGGNDTIDGGAGIDEMFGGAGNDTYTVGSSGDLVDEASFGGAGTDKVLSTITFNLTESATVRGSVENLTLIGTSAINGIGNSLANSIIGNVAVNIINGGGGNDSLNGLAGNDTLAGGIGIDSFVFSTALSATTNVDRITDFSVADDTIRLENGIFTALTTAGVLASTAFTANASGIALDASDRIIYETDTGNIFYDSNGNAAGGSVLFAKVGINFGLTANDFVIF